ncbi:SRPBCC domain-containing protein [Streptomyces sp. NPDC012888]|uniref:SRPBCC domain-containing protein n=1 Tax=Streptomyces sp. NPDC012888 TaxID=3364855 RepID=UPI003699210A
MPPVSHGTSERRPGDADHWLLHFAPHLAHAYTEVWPALTTADGLRGWLASAEVLERHLGGEVRLRWLNGPGTTATGHVTAWDVERVVEYTLSEHGRIRFHLEPLGTDSTLIRFTNERRGTEADRLDCLAGWHEHFLLLEDHLAGAPADWPSRTANRWSALRDSYAAQLHRASR